MHITGSPAELDLDWRKKAFYGAGAGESKWSAVVACPSLFLFAHCVSLSSSLPSLFPT